MNLLNKLKMWKQDKYKKNLNVKLALFLYLNVGCVLVLLMLNSFMFIQFVVFVVWLGSLLGVYLESYNLGKYTGRNWSKKEMEKLHKFDKYFKEF